jgi:hypothetical protein
VILVIQAEVYCNLLNYLSAYLKSVRWSLDYYLLIVSSSSAYYILIIAPFFFGCRGPVKEENKNNASASSLSLHVGNEKYIIIDTKESVVAWKSSSVRFKPETF